MGGPGSGKPPSRRPPSRWSRGWLPRADKRFVAVRSVVEHAQAVTADLGGASELTRLQRDLVVRASYLVAKIEEAEAAALQGEAVDHHLHLARLDRLVRVAQLLGVERRAREVPSLSDFIERTVRERDAAKGDADE